MNKRTHSQEFIESECLKRGIVVLSKYESAKAPLKLRCPKGHEFISTWDTIKNLWGCKYCSKKVKKTFPEVKKMFEDEGYKMLSTEYEGVFVKMKVICPGGHNVEISTDKFRQGRRCAICRGTKKKNLKQIKSIFEEEGFEVLSDRYEHVKAKLKIKCPEGHIYEMTPDKFLRGQRCRRCHIENYVGENHWAWNPELTDEERLINRDIAENVKWRNEVYKRDDYTCRKCHQKGGRLNAHHIFNYSNHKEQRFNLENGITFCQKCHVEFHKVYGKQDNNEWQVKEFIGDDELWNLIPINA